RPVRVEPAGPRVLRDGVAERTTAVSRPEGEDVVAIPLDPLAGREFLDPDLVGHPLDAEVHGGIQNRTAALGRPERNRLLAALEPHRPEQADHAEEMVGVHVREEDVTDREARLEPHHLTLRALAAIEEHLLALTVEVDRTDVAADRRAAGGGAEKGDPDHPFASPRNRYAPMARNAYPTYRVRGHGVATGPSNRRRSTPSRINSTRRPCLASIAIAVASRIPNR